MRTSIQIIELGDIYPMSLSTIELFREIKNLLT